MTATVIVGNPKPASRTRTVAVDLARAVLARAGETSEPVVIEVSELKAGLFAWGDPAVAAAKQAVMSGDLLVVASPVYKASITGLLKAFLDQFAQDELGALATVPLMVGAGPGHALAVEAHLRPVLVEIGASCPTRGVYVLESEVDDPATWLDPWLERWGPALLAVKATR